MTCASVSARFGPPLHESGWSGTSARFPEEEGGERPRGDPRAQGWGGRHLPTVCLCGTPRHYACGKTFVRS